MFKKNDQATKPDLTSHKWLIFSKFSAEMINKVCSIITFPIVARSLSTQGYGINSQLSTIINFIAPLMTLGLGYSIIKSLSSDNGRHLVAGSFMRIYGLVAVTSGIAALIFFLAAAQIDRLFFQSIDASGLIRLASVLIMLGAFELLMIDFYRTRMMIIQISLLQTFQTIIVALGTVVILQIGFGLKEIIILSLGAKALFLVAGLLYFFHSHSRTSGWSLRESMAMGSAIRFGLPLLVAGLANWFMHLSDRLVLGWFVSIDEVGQYSLAYTLAIMITAIGSPFWGPLYPQIAKYKAEGRLDGVKSICRQYNIWFFILALPFTAGLIVISKPLISTLGTEKFVVSSWTFGLIAIGILSDQVSSCAHYILNLFKSPSLMLYASIAGGLLNFALNLALVPVMGIKGAAAATLISFVFFDFILFRGCIAAGFKLGDLFDLKISARILLASLVMAFFVKLIVDFPMGNELKLLVSVSAGVVIYAVILLVLMRKDAHLLLRSVHKVKTVSEV